MSTLFDPVTVGALRLPSRLVMAPMTRNRATPEGVVTPATAEYYAQRAGAGLIVSESIQPSVQGQGYVLTPGLHSAEQVAAWRTVTTAVHDRGGRIVAQLTHCGRIGHPSLYPDGGLPVAPSAVASGEQLIGLDGPVDHPVPRELTTAEVADVVEELAQAARNAVEAGFDGVEVHGGNGFLVHQFLADNTNLRSDAYGGSVENRTRFAVEVVRAVSDAVGADRVGIRISPGSPYNGIVEADPVPVYTALLEELAVLGIAYLHVVEMGTRDLTERLRAVWPGTLVLNPHGTAADFPATPDAAHAALASGVADAVSLGVLWLANPDLDERLRAGGPLNVPDPATFYGGDHVGYTDYPTLEHAGRHA
ncbi:NADH:flavin oxidoreductase/NADH oxidase [Cellulomonas flavigena DSM 20109]|uniref:NADH:flavin oxidoreductase/NADH oxidase n=1 Tax=Cellulomonas flavigena (strain ATCC 482 / DSM 20109 / BCRC 11376 / JCM 18109 / NBRC 3775 / NCIMB 8073 / NRS 134) TaxID=446466 RepID=D5UCM8_CELFN|nr:alkene reductase [Cellulomonas flavigena]ADG76263.1 NADH:flavin oxidoreductase/NADH oxidase [Cellulomonas flavigena DSM 20109]